MTLSYWHIAYCQLKLSVVLTLVPYRISISILKPVFIVPFLPLLSTSVRCAGVKMRKRRECKKLRAFLHNNFVCYVRIGICVMKCLVLHMLKY